MQFAKPTLQPRDRMFSSNLLATRTIKHSPNTTLLLRQAVMSAWPVLVSSMTVA